MDFTLNEEQRDFQQALRRFVDREIVPVASEWERTGRYPTEIVDHLKAMGLFGLTTPLITHEERRNAGHQPYSPDVQDGSCPEPT